MPNYFQRNLDSDANHIGDQLGHGGLFAVGWYAFGLIEGNAGDLVSAMGLWAVTYGVYAPYLVRRVRIRTPSGDTWLAAAFVLYGAAPAVLYLPFWTMLTAPTGAMIAFPLAAIWSTTALILAVWDRAAPQQTAARGRFLLVAGLLGAVAMLIYAGLWIGLFTGVWTPPGAYVLRTVIGLILAAPFAWLSAYFAIELIGQANQIDHGE